MVRSLAPWASPMILRIANKPKCKSVTWRFTTCSLDFPIVPFYRIALVRQLHWLAVIAKRSQYSCWIWITSRTSTLARSLGGRPAPGSGFETLASMPPHKRHCGAVGRRRICDRPFGSHRQPKYPASCAQGAHRTRGADSNRRPRANDPCQHRH